MSLSSDFFGSRVTVCAIATVNELLAIRALRRVCNLLPNTPLVFCSSQTEPHEIDFAAVLHHTPPFRGKDDYSRFTLLHLADVVRTEYVLLIQWDGFVLDPCSWDTDFLNYDYIGAVWPHFKTPLSVGNGGFSLRSRCLLKACQDPDFVYSHPEDKCICHCNRELLEKKYKLRFAPPDVAERFSYERQRPKGKTFGFHGLFNFPDFMPPDELREFIRSIPDDMLQGRDAHDLCMRLIDSKDRSLFPAADRIFRIVSRTRPWGYAGLLRLAGAFYSARGRYYSTATPRWAKPISSKTPEQASYGNRQG